MHHLVSVDSIVCVEVRSRPSILVRPTRESRIRSAPYVVLLRSCLSCQRKRYRGHYLVQAFCFVFIITSLSRLLCGKMTAFKARGGSESSREYLGHRPLITPCMTAPLRETNLNGGHCKSCGIYLLQSGAIHVLFQSVFILYFGNDG